MLFFHHTKGIVDITPPHPWSYCCPECQIFKHLLGTTGDAGVYKIPCSCEKEYIGETKRALGIRLKAATRRGEVKKSAIARAEQHHPPWEEISILQQAYRDDVLKIKEALCIATAEHQKSLNRDQRTAISNCWKPLL